MQWATARLIDSGYQWILHQATAILIHKHTHTSTHTSTHTHKHTHTSTHTHTCTHTHARTHTHMHTHTNTHTHTHTHARTHTHMHAHTCPLCIPCGQVAVSGCRLLHRELVDRSAEQEIVWDPQECHMCSCELLLHELDKTFVCACTHARMCVCVHAHTCM